jgi:invasion protein IalB
MRRLGRCRRWRDAALGLGETFAGHSLRAALVSRHCALLDATESRHASVWSWPWSTLEVGHGLPPRLHRSFGQWQIRCGDGAERQRCALIHQVAVAPGGPPDDPPADVVTTHFVIDHVAGREILLWRLFVPRRTSGLLVSAAASAVTQDGGLTARLRIGLRRHSLRSTVCRAGGCMIEIGGTRAGKIATGLAAGHSLRLDLFTGKAGAIEAEIGAEGFAQGLVELIRQRRAERNLNAPR